MSQPGERRKVRRDRRTPDAKPSSQPEQTGLPAVAIAQAESTPGAGAARRRGRPRQATPPSVTEENQQLHAQLREHIARLQEVNRELVITSVKTQALAEQLRSTQSEMTHLAHHDHLTGLPNRIQFKDLLATAMESARQLNGKLGLLFIDLDRFKVVNDSLGHSIGDQLLQAVAHRLTASVRGSDVVSRQGGDEFVALLSNVHHVQDLSSRVQHIHNLITAPYTIANHVLHVGASIGISVYPDDVAEIDSLIRNADMAMYAVKEQGRNKFAFFEPPMTERALARHQMDVNLRNALKRNEFVLHYQPQLDLCTHQVSGAEALIRWHHPSEGLLLPAAFVPFAEECGLINLLDGWVLREACRQGAEWIESGLKPTSISVNVSAQEFDRAEFVPIVLATLSDTRFPPQFLELELTEGTLMRDTAATMEKLGALRSAGIRIAIDDFGTGYSSLSYLRRLPIDTLKIDQTFVSDVTPESGSVLVDAVIKIGNHLHYRVIAEGIETAEQLQFLQEHHCGAGQGTHLATPMCAADFAVFVQEHARPAP
jgi:diguanylate cyclase (GGDEF)-like protein